MNKLFKFCLSYFVSCLDFIFLIICIALELLLNIIINLTELCLNWNSYSYLPEFPYNFISEDKSINIFKIIIEYLNGFIAPQPSNFTIEVLSNQIHDISIILFVLSIVILLLIIALLFNVIILINSERIINYFNNKYIKWYVGITMKFIGLEVIILGGTIIFGMHSLITGIQYIVQHPVIIT